MKAKLTTNEKLNKIFPTVKVLWDNVTDEDCCSYIGSAVHAICGHYELYLDDTTDNEVAIDAEFVTYWMELCNRGDLTISLIKTLYNNTIDVFAELEQDGNDALYAYDEIAH